MALEMINDPQGFTEKLFKRLKRSRERYDMKLMMMTLIARMIGTHRLVVLSFYSYLQKYMASPAQVRAGQMAVQALCSTRCCPLEA